ncbi:hypothetical protein P5673_010654 [Acropora cervicornis]|uniref:Uncharacterized protein n=1 Tax=Acropora cervicornis TaxID=6130 RepID=A0AAD9QQF4_ACRCE|nr:hypothetical protein P5673_010654 [Acropora cervicornis]
MPPEDVVKTQIIASLRIHVEPAINKIKLKFPYLGPNEFPVLLAVSVLSVDELRSVLGVSGLLFGLSSVKVPSKSRVEVSSGDNSSLYPSTVESPSNSKLSSPRSSSLS